MDWWNDLTDWISSDDGWRVISGAIIPFVAIVVAGIVAALIGRGATKRVVAMQEREARNAAVAGIVSAARKAATWGSLGHDERAYADHLAEDADIRLRLLPVAGAPLAANWTQHEIADIKKNSSTFSFQAEQSLAEFRDRLLEWQARPGRARKLFKSDLERWKFDSPDPDAELITRQQEWNADQSGSSRSADGAAPGTGTDAESPRPTPTTTSLRPAVQRPAATPASAAPAVSGTPSAPPTSAAPAAARPGSAAGAGFSVTRGGSTAVAPDATTPISASSSTNTTTSFSDGNTTRAYGDGAAAPTRPPLGSPASPVRTGGSSAVTSARGSDAGSADSGSSDSGDADAGNADAGPADTDNADTVDDRRAAGANPSTRATAGSPVPPPVAKPTSADAHVNRAQDADARKVGAPGTTQTTSVPTRIAGAPAEPADANETSEAPYTQPISASELRRRAADDE
ncbi:hypothetical protein FHW23_002636 [Curtobacterium pusillum]|uniref:DUF4129 domain-containing protein n=1 Tax=Curtobacterium pusillum TaxID=69373 RepID=A0AAW3TA48_9MICO|nr:hypothetical protein [Curtobacterium pusillum]MBA8991367.1 hypothetical protein [Curtobacterium pusillum]